MDCGKPDVHGGPCDPVTHRYRPTCSQCSGMDKDCPACGGAA